MNSRLRQMLATLAVILAAASGLGETFPSEAVFPFPREAAAQGGYLKLPETVGIAFPAGLKDAVADLEAPGAACGVKLVPQPPEQALIRLSLEKDGVPDHDEGYALTIDRSGVGISARTEAGLFYGLQTLRSLLTTAGKAGLPCCRIADFPRFDRRGVAFSLRSADPGKLDHVKMFLRTAAALKYNCAAIEFADNFPYRDDPFPNRPRRFTAAEIDELVKYAEARFIRIVPLLRIWNDCPMLGAYPRRDALLELPYGKYMRYTYCPQHPEVAELIGRVVAGQTGALHSKCFIFHLDRTGLRQSSRQCAKCRDAEIGKLAAEHFAELGKKCAAHGVKPEFMLCADPSRLPHRYRERAPRHAAATGFDCVAAAPLGHVGIMKENIRRAAADGKRAFILDGMTSIRSGALLPLTNNTVYSTGGLVDGAGFLWSGAESPRHPDATALFFSLLHDKSRAAETASAVPVPLGKALNAALNLCGDFPVFTPPELKELARDLAARPEKFRLTTGLGGSYCGIRLAGERFDDPYPAKAEIALGGVTASAIDLVVSCTPPPQRAEYSPWHGSAKLFAQPPIATVTVYHENGKSWSVPLRYTNGISDWNRPYGGYKLRTAAMLRDTPGRYCRFDALHLRNPHPELPLKRLVLSSARHDGIAPVLLALSLENAQGGALPTGSFDGVPLPTRAPETPGRDKLVQWDFEDSSLKNAYPETTNMVFAAGAKPKIDYLVDTASPSHDRVLRLTIPAATAEDPGRPLKVAVNFPWAPRGTVKSLVLSCRIDRPENLLGAFQILENTLDKSRYTQEFFPAEKWGVFHTALDNRDTLSFNPLRDVRRCNLRRALFVFDALPRGVEIRLDDVGVSRLRRHDLPDFPAE